MAKINLRPMIFALVTLLAAASTFAAAADGPSTFDSFYRPTISINWALAALAALITGILVIIGWPVIAPAIGAIIGTVGTAVGGLFGLSGIAATNAGLALLGGGTIATGGFGILGGTAVLAAALTFGTEVTFDYAVGSVISAYEKKKFAEASLKMMTLPFPQNASGPDSVRAAVTALESTPIKDSLRCSRELMNGKDAYKTCVISLQKSHREMIHAALAAMAANSGDTTAKDVERESAMYALLHFLNNDYPAARAFSNRAYAEGLKANHTPTLPAFIYGASLLYEDRPNMTDSLAKFQYAIAAEPRNPLTPVLFATYLDRLSYRLNDGAASADHLEALNRFAASLADDERKLVIQQILLSHYFMQIKLAQQKVLSLTGTQNATIRNNPNTLPIVRGALRDYSQLVKGSAGILHRENQLLFTVISQGQGSLFSGNKALTDNDNGWPKVIQQFRGVLARYEQGQAELQARVAAFEQEVAAILAAKEQEQREAAEPKGLMGWIKGVIQKIINW